MQESIKLKHLLKRTTEVFKKVEDRQPLNQVYCEKEACSIKDVSNGILRAILHRKGTNQTNAGLSSSQWILCTPLSTTDDSPSSPSCHPIRGAILPLTHKLATVAVHLHLLTPDG
jgi:hypothetical protein